MNLTNLKHLLFSLSLILLFTLQACNKQSPSHYLKNANAKYQLQNYQGAIIDLNRAIELEANYPEAYYLRALCFSNLDDLENAEADYSKTISLKSDYKEAYFNRAYYIYQKNEAFQKAIEDYNYFLMLKPEKYVAFALNNRGWSEFKLGKYAKALDDIDQSIRKNSQNNLAHKNRALVLFAMDSLDAACKSYENAIQLGFVPEINEPLIDSLDIWCSNE